jgi:putative nucleotidyltransferase with HDIG domain
MATTASELGRDVGGLITLPDVYLRISHLLDDPNSSAADIARVIAADPSFTLRLLRVANSPIYKTSQGVSTVARAVTVIGMAQIANLALSMSVASSFEGLPNALVSPANFWRHSLYCALAARHLAKVMGRCDRDALFTAGLLHDIGELVIFNRLPEQARTALMLVLDSGDEIPIHQAEQQVLGFDHADVGAEMARQWHLPPLLEECIAYHHRIEAAQKHPREVALIHICNVLAQMAELDDFDGADFEPIAPAAWEITGLDMDCVEPTLRLVQAEIAEVEQMFAGGKA